MVDGEREYLWLLTRIDDERIHSLFCRHGRVRAKFHRVVECAFDTRASKKALVIPPCGLLTYCTRFTPPQVALNGMNFNSACVRWIEEVAGVACPAACNDHKARGECGKTVPRPQQPPLSTDHAVARTASMNVVRGGVCNARRFARGADNRAHVSSLRENILDAARRHGPLSSSSVPSTRTPLRNDGSLR